MGLCASAPGKPTVDTTSRRAKMRSICSGFPGVLRIASTLQPETPGGALRKT